MRRRASLILGLLAPLAAGPLAAQQIRLPIEWRWFVNASTGFYAFPGATFDAIDAGLRSGGWSTLNGQCVGGGCQGPSGYAIHKVMPFTVAVRRAFSERAQLRLLGSLVQPGTLEGTSGSYRVQVTPSSTVIAAQAVYALGPVWLGVGPSVNFASITSGSAAAPVTTKATKPGIAAGVGFTFPRHTALWLEVAAEGRYMGSLDVPVIPVPGAPDIPAMSVPMSHHIITIGAGWRFP